MLRDKCVASFRDASETWHVLIDPEETAFAWSFGQDAEDRFGTGEDRTIRFNQLNGTLVGIGCDLGKARLQARRLRRLEVRAFFHACFPSVDPAAAKVAIAVENQQRFFRRIGNFDFFFHCRKTRDSRLLLKQDYIGA